ncbi:hypothetical protein [Halomarina litorea]|uniref:hypothetical protein n=1 Tax=Halomarina litorea TaxID=2961595 RepID=UPI0020C48DBE|nr:hypothetical protein [Halomarina sp. BCD28]
MTANESTQVPSNSSRQSGTSNNTTGAAGPAVGVGGGAGSMRGSEPKSGICKDLGAIQTMTCNGAIGTLQGIGDGVGELYGDVMQGVVYFIVNRPRAMDGGEPSLAGQPTNQPMETVYDIWLNKGLAAGVAVWGFFMLFNQFRGVFPTGATSSYSRDKMARRGWFILGFMLASWPISMALLHLAHGLSTFIAPGSEALSADLQTATGTNAAAVIGGLALYFASGVVALFAAIEFILAYVGVFVLTPYLPLAMALTTPDFWIFDRVASIGETIVSLYIPTVFFTLPTAMVLGAGYPLANALATNIPDAFAFIPGLATGTTAVMGVLLLAVWILALLAPVFVFAGASQMRLFSGMLAGATGALAISKLRNRSGTAAAAGEAASSATASTGASSGSVSSGLSHKTNPIQGSSFSTDTAGSGIVATQESTANISNSSAAISPQTDSIGATTNQTSRIGTTTGTGTTSTTGTRQKTTSGEPTVLYDRGQFNGEKNYLVGYLDSDDEFQSIYREGRNGKWLVDQGAYSRLESNFSDERLLLRDKGSKELYDVQNIVGDRLRNQGAYDDIKSQNQASRDVVYDTWGQ